MYRDGDIVVTRDNLVFTVLGYTHPPSRVIAILKYIPEELKHLFPGRYEEARWKLAETTLLRQVDALAPGGYMRALRALREHLPAYTYYCPYLNKLLIAVPTSRIELHITPQEGRLLLEGKKRRDPLEQKAIGLIQLLEREAKLPEHTVGLRGSIALQMHTPSSDIDLTVEGAENYVRAVKAALTLEERGVLKVSRASWIEKRRLNRGTYRGARFVVNAVKPLHEIAERYGEKRYRQVARIRGTCEVTDSRLSHYRPAAYRIHAATSPSPEYLTSWSGEHRSLFQEGEQVEFKGTLELVSDKSGVYYQVVVGTAPGDYLKPKIED